MNDQQPSSTALLVARAVYFVSLDHDLGSLVSAEEASLLARFVSAASPGSTWFLRLAAFGWFRWIVCSFQKLTAQGMLAFLAVRKRHIETLVRQAIGDGCTEVVIVGAGYDTLATRLRPEFPSVRFIEIDHPATQSPKLRVIGNPGPNLEFLAVDLTKTSLDAAMRSSKLHDPAGKAVFVAEGLTMYLTEAEVRTLLRSVAGCCPAGSRLIFTFLEPIDGKAQVGTVPWLTNVYLKLNNEEFKWGIEREQLPAFLESERLEMRALFSGNGLQEIYLPNGEASLPNWELIAEAQCTG